MVCVEAEKSEISKPRHKTTAIDTTDQQWYQGQTARLVTLLSKFVSSYESSYFADRLKSVVVVVITVSFQGNRQRAKSNEFESTFFGSAHANEKLNHVPIVG